MSPWSLIRRIAGTAGLLVVGYLLVNFGVGVYFSLQVMTITIIAAVIRVF